ncbi:hypothetical protein Adi01nite_63910 [Amorphoplanes digitatis]|nr:hypothetical protein Adi01nite_63910 [Actinoplanes digitatis]
MKWRLRNHSQAPIFDLLVWMDEWEDNRWGEVIEDQATGTAKCDPPCPSTRIPMTPASPW